ncbi:metal ABC transporter solute-binding protein, Zn/Mn family [Vreelandella jeotgali]|uniref:metal ABC transporter solute-binding protein, Zn/Mn family n=1 Tax=Vreelandella jeotgali TaxID=553386 RepID=UPI000345BCB9|nr:zinc ABC transporter substrate-binding protein [Halomonas jeotgali]
MNPSAGRYRPSQLTLAALLLAASALCPAVGAAERVQVVASFSILADMVDNVGGEHVDVTPLIGADSDAHSYSPSPGDVRALSGADLVVFNGLNFEGWMDRLLETSDYRGPRVTATRHITPLRHAGQHHHDRDDASREADDRSIPEGVADPHAWQDMTRAGTYVTNIRDGLIDADSAHAADYRANAEAYLARLDRADNAIRDQLNELDDEATIITGHDSFGYFADAYGLHFRAPEGMATSSAPGAARMAALVDTIRQRNVEALFYENMTSPGTVDQLAEETGLPVAGTLYADALADDGEASSYIGMMRHNARLLHRALAD